MKSAILIYLIGYCVQAQAPKVPKRASITFDDELSDRNPRTNSYDFDRESKAQFNFATRIYKQVASGSNVGSGDNILISPFSLRAVGSLIYLASDGKTAEEIRQVLNLPLSYDEVVSNLNTQFSSAWKSRSAEYNNGNALIVSNTMNLNSNFSHLAKNRLGLDIIRNDFTNTQHSANRINNWVSGITNGRIQKILNPEAVSEQTSVMVVNALFFQDTWELPFNPLPTEHQFIFTLSNGRRVDVEGMQVERAFGYKYVDALKATVIVLPFKDSRFELIIVKPTERSDLQYVESRLDSNFLSELSNQLSQHKTNVLLRMPKFKLNGNYGLVDAFRKLGISHLFDPAKADLSKLTAEKSSRHFVSQLVHQTLLQIDEKGAEAAAGTVGGIFPISAPSQLDLNRPFLFLLNDKMGTGPLFIGRVVNPAKR